MEAGKAFIALICLMGAVLCDDSSESSYSFDSSESEVFSTPPTYFEYKVMSLNTALHYTLLALHDDLRDGVEVDIGFLKRIEVIITLIKSFYGDVDETNTLMLREILKAYPEYLDTKIHKAGLNFNEYTATSATETSIIIN